MAVPPPGSDDEERYRIAFAEAPDGVAIVSMDGRYLQLNRALADMVGYTVDELVGRPTADVSLPQDADEHARCRRDLVERGQMTCERRYVHKDGHVVPARVSASLVKDAAGRPRYLVVHVQDRTAALREEEERRALEERLRRAQHLESVGRLAGGVAHDFNNLLSIILNYVDFARRRNGDARVEEWLSQVSRAGARAASLTRQLMMFGRRDRAEPQVLAFDAAVLDAVHLLGRTLGEDIALDVRAGAADARVRMAPEHVSQIVMNLAVNARDAMPRGGRLTIATGPVDGGTVELLVADEGVGMTPDVAALVFEPFFTTKEPGRGTGLGLAIVYGLVQEAGGTITLDTAPGEGARFTVRLPTVAGAVPEPAREPDADGPRGRGERVVVVEDEADVRALTARILEDAGYAVVVFGDPAAALGWCGAERFDLLVTDVVMPDLSGPDLARSLLASREGLRVLFVSGYAADRLSRQDLDAGASLLPKPFTADALRRAVRAALDRP